jgi:signal transduction histidine kinase/CheY-like chemotaxis protein
MKTSSPLFRRYVRILVICMAGVTCTAGVIHMAVVVKAQWASVASLLDVQTRAASSQIQAFLDKTVASLQWIDDIDQPGATLDMGAMRDEAHRLLRRAPSVINMSFFDANGCKRLTVSRLEPDSTHDCLAYSEHSPGGELFARARKSGLDIGNVFFPDQSEPHLLIAIASRGQGTGVLVAEVNLKVIHDTIAAVHVGQSGLGFVVDGPGRLIGHPDETFVLRQVRLPPGLDQGLSLAGLTFSIDFSGEQVTTASRRIEGTSWRIFVEQPVREALAPVITALWTTGILVVAALASSLIAGFIVARRLARPLSQLRDGAARIGQGDLATRLKVNTGDEIEQVAQEFNRMAVALLDSHAHLEAKVADRTAALQETTTKIQQQATELAALNTALGASLEEAQQRKSDAERANAAKSRFLAVASHDLRQPMQAVSLLVGILGRGVTSHEQNEIICKIRACVNAMDDLFVSLLDMSKLDAGAVHPSIANFPIEEVLQRVRSTFSPVAEQRSLELCVDSSTALVRSDPALLERILFNLISNGIRYTVKGSVRLCMKAHGHQLIVTVQDTGIGIPTEFQERVFEEFFQITTSPSRGLGLGLSIVKQCAQLLGHSLSLQSDASGSNFALTVPLVGEISEPPRAPSQVREVSERLRSAFVAIIDDDADNRYAVDATYRQWGCRTLAADGEDQMLELLEEHLRAPDLIVSDFNLAGARTGMTAIEAIRLQAECRVPAIVITGEGGILAAASLPEECALLQKPVGSGRLQEVSEALLARAAISEGAADSLVLTD